MTQVANKLTNFIIHVTARLKQLNVAQMFFSSSVELDVFMEWSTPNFKSSGQIQPLRFIQNYMSTEAAKMYMHSVVFSHISYYLAAWLQASTTTL